MTCARAAAYRQLTQALVIGGLEQLAGSLLPAGRNGRVDDLALSRLRSPGVCRSMTDSERDPVTAGEAEFSLAHVLQHAAGLLDDASRSRVAVIAGHQNLAQAQRRWPPQYVPVARERWFGAEKSAWLTAVAGDGSLS